MVRSDGTFTKVGGVSSMICMTCESVATLPHSSTAVHVLVMIFSPEHFPGAVFSANVSCTVSEHSSSAVTVGNDGKPAAQLTVTSSGTPLMSGGVLSITFTLNSKMLEFPHSSVAFT